MRYILMCGLIFFAIGTGSVVSGQSEVHLVKSSEGAVERQYDRFKDETTLTLKPQRILDSKSPRQVIDMTIKAIFDGVRPKNLTDAIQITFTSAAEEEPDYDGESLNFIVDGERVKRYEISVLPATASRAALAPDLKTSKDIYVVISFPALYQIANGKKVEMKLGPTELTLDAKTLESLRQFSAALFSK
ncbi:MAG TPA: hypothetical protein VJ302_16045 [Blastocatellia bacterium]|nr:hypothetical protein [Blastocatellia bacterium]